MAKKKRSHSKKVRNQTQFFEAMPAAALPTLPQQASSAWVDGALERVFESLELAGAAVIDIFRFLRIAAKRLWSRRLRRTYLMLSVLIVATAVAAAVLVATTTYAIYGKDLSSPAAMASKHKTGTTILDRNGKVLYQVYGAAEHESISYSNIPQTMVNATLAAEDDEFFKHPGFSIRGIARAFYKNITERGTMEGGSTLTQQLVKNTLLTPERNLGRKLQEIALATEVERRYTKDQIMEMYLNDIYYGEGSTGIATAAQTYFKKEVKDLTIGEQALLAGLPLGPSRFDPAVYPEAARARRDFVLDRMQSLGFITDAELTTAKAEPINASARQVKIEAPHFVFYVLDQLRAQYGDEMVEHGGITVTTTLDLDKQNLAQNLAHEQINNLRYRHVTNAALVSITPADGEIISMVGSYDYYDPNYGSVNVATSERQPGSSMKPICYLAGFTKGMNGATVLDDKPLHIPDGSGQVYSPTDYDQKFRGQVTVRRAIAGSLNIPAVNMLKQIGIDTCIDMAHTLGITTLNDRERYGLSLTLGAGEVKMIDMAAAYATLANGGVKVNPVAIKQVVDRNGADITKKTEKPDPKPVVDPRYVYMMSSILSDNVAKEEIFGVNTPFKIAPHQVAVKTGTTTDFRDNWTAGYTPDIATVVWTGNNDNSPEGQVDGFTGAAPIWHDFMAAYLKDKPVHPFTAPPGVITQKVCFMGNGGLANPWDGRVADEVFLAEAPQKVKCASTAPKPPEEKHDDENKDKDKEQQQQQTTPSSDTTTPDPNTTDPTPSKPTKHKPGDL